MSRAFSNAGRWPTRLALLATIVGGVLPTADGYVKIDLHEDHQWAALAGLLGHPPSGPHPQRATRLARRDACVTPPARPAGVGRPARTVGGDVDQKPYNCGYDTLSTGKTGGGIDLKRPAERAGVHDLVASADILLETFRPGVAQHLSLGPAEPSALNKRFLMRSASTCGQQHMAGKYVGYAAVFVAFSGLTHATVHADGPPTEVSTPVEFFAGLVAVPALLADLHRRHAADLMTAVRAAPGFVQGLVGWRVNPVVEDSFCRLGALPAKALAVDLVEEMWFASPAALHAAFASADYTQRVAPVASRLFATGGRQSFEAHEAMFFDGVPLTPAAARG